MFQSRCVTNFGTDLPNEITWEFSLKSNDVTLCIRGIAIDASGEKGRGGGREFLFLFPPSKRMGGEAGNNLQKLGKEQKSQKVP